MAKLNITRNRGRWYPIFIRSGRDIERLNSLFGKGWFLDHIGLEGMPYMAFSAPLSDPDEPPPAAAGEMALPCSGDDVLMVILTKGTVRNKQRAMLLEPDASGYRDMSTISDRIAADGGGWRLFAAIAMERRNLLVVLSR